MLDSRTIVAIALPLLVAACGGGMSHAPDPGPGPVEPPPGNSLHPDLRKLRGAVSELAVKLAQRDGHVPPTLDSDGLGARDTEMARLADRAIRSDTLFLDAAAEWSPAGTPLHPHSRRDNALFTPVGKERGAELGTYTARWTTEPGYETTLRLGWGAWLEHSRFGVIRDDSLLEEHGNRFAKLHAWSDGRATRFLQEGGGATYRGIALAHRTTGLRSRADLLSGTDKRPMAGLLLGKATIEANFGYGTVDVAVHDLVELAANAPADDASVTWRGISISLETMSISNDTSSLSMSFYGRNGAEVGGVFRTEAMIGAFGAGR